MSMIENVPRSGEEVGQNRVTEGLVNHVKNSYFIPCAGRDFKQGDNMITFLLSKDSSSWNVENRLLVAKERQ